MTIRLSNAQSRALEKLDRTESRSPAEIGESRVTCDALTIAGYARKAGDGYVKIKELW